MVGRDLSRNPNTRYTLTYYRYSSITTAPTHYRTTPTLYRLTPSRLSAYRPRLTRVPAPGPALPLTLRRYNANPHYLPRHPLHR